MIAGALHGHARLSNLPDRLGQVVEPPRPAVQKDYADDMMSLALDRIHRHTGSEPFRC